MTSSLLLFLPERMKIEKVEKLVANLHDETDVMYIRNLKLSFNRELVRDIKLHRDIKFNQKVWLKPYIDMNTDLRKKSKKILKKIFFKLQFLEKLSGMLENIKMLNLLQQKEEEII